jgi:hypothetical protein
MDNSGQLGMKTYSDGQKGTWNFFYGQKGSSCFMAKKEFAQKASIYKKQYSSKLNPERSGTSFFFANYFMVANIKLLTSGRR